MQVLERTKLSEREDQVVELASKGLTDAQIALRMGIRIGTVNSYWVRIRQKLGHFSRTEFASMAVRAKAKGKIDQMIETSECLERQAEEAVRYAMAFEALPLPLFSFSGEHEILFANKRFRALLGYEDEELMGLPIDRVFRLGTDEPLSSLLNSSQGQCARQLLEEGHVIGLDKPLYGRSASGEAFPLVLSLGSWRNANRIIWSGTVHSSPRIEAGFGRELGGAGFGLQR